MEEKTVIFYQEPTLKFFESYHNTRWLSLLEIRAQRHHLYCHH